MKANSKKSLTLILLLLGLIIIIPDTYSQTAKIRGRVVDVNNRPIELANVLVMPANKGTTTSKEGTFEVLIPADSNQMLTVSFVGYYQKKLRLFLNAGSEKDIKIVMMPLTKQLPDYNVVGEKTKPIGMMEIKYQEANYIPSVSGSGIEELVKRTALGVSSFSELSSQYSVRGGNFDENLIYVNDIEIYRPLLVRSGQQEGLSFLNPQLVSSVYFSAGGFASKYGDKMSSVMDVTYKKPVDFGGSVHMSLLGASAHIEGASKKKPFTYLLGVRQKSNQYLLGSLETKGDYKPSFTDVQTYLTYDLNKKWELSFLGNYALNVYNVIPSTRSTRYGTVNEAYRFTVYFDGREADRFQTSMGALTATYKPQKNLIIKMISSVYRSEEEETFDIQGQYWLDQLETDFGDDEFGEIAFNRGVGTFLNHARNDLNALVYNLQTRGDYLKNGHKLSWGLQAQREQITDKIHEWEMLDSAGYSLPHMKDIVDYPDPSVRPSQDIYMNNYLSAELELNSFRYTGFIQDQWKPLSDSLQLVITGGVRFHYWDVNEQFLLSPRFMIAYKPNWFRDMQFRLSSGMYSQPAFYRELRDFDGVLHTDRKAQQSYHVVGGLEYHFNSWHRPFIWVTEVYYKHMENLIPYEIDNVRIRYHSDQISQGYATGIDMKIHGEFVKGVDSYASISYMKTAEDIEDDWYYNYFNKDGDKIIPGYTFDQVATDSQFVEPGYLSRPTDQRFSFSLFFQDYLPLNPTYKVHLNLVYGGGLPFGAPKTEKYQQQLRMNAYRRVDIGFSKLLKDEYTKLPSQNPFRHFKSIWLSAEVFNLLQINNTVSYLWITDISNRQYAIPNYLTPRLINVKLLMDF